MSRRGQLKPVNFARNDPEDLFGHTQGKRSRHRSEARRKRRAHLQPPKTRSQILWEEFLKGHFSAVGEFELPKGVTRLYGVDRSMNDPPFYVYRWTCPGKWYLARYKGQGYDMQGKC